MSDQTSASGAQGSYQDELKRTISPFQSFAVAFGFVSIATGIFTTYGSVLNSSGPMGIWTWPIVVFGQLMVAFIFGALAARIPVTGYAYQWMSRLTNPVLGWIMGWICFMGSSINPVFSHSLFSDPFFSETFQSIL